MRDGSVHCDGGFGRLAGAIDQPINQSIDRSIPLIGRATGRHLKPCRSEEQKEEAGGGRSL